jgi:hypothetical protein
MVIEPTLQALVRLNNTLTHAIEQTSGMDRSGRWFMTERNSAVKRVPNVFPPNTVDVNGSSTIRELAHRMEQHVRGFTAVRDFHVDFKGIPDQAAEFQRKMIQQRCPWGVFVHCMDNLMPVTKLECDTKSSRASASAGMPSFSRSPVRSASVAMPPSSRSSGMPSYRSSHHATRSTSSRSIATQPSYSRASRSTPGTGAGSRGLTPGAGVLLLEVFFRRVAPVRSELAVILFRDRLSGKYCDPGGGIEANEPAASCAQRELAEESLGMFYIRHDMMPRAFQPPSMPYYTVFVLPVKGPPGTGIRVSDYDRNLKFAKAAYGSNVVPWFETDRMTRVFVSDIMQAAPDRPGDLSVRDVYGDALTIDGRAKAAIRDAHRAFNGFVNMPFRDLSRRHEPMGVPGDRLHRASKQAVRYEA